MLTKEIFENANWCIMSIMEDRIMQMTNCDRSVANLIANEVLILDKESKEILGENTFGDVSWHKIDIEHALRKHNYCVTQDMVDLIYNKCNNHHFIDKMIESGWETIDYYIYENKNELDSLSIK